MTAIGYFAYSRDDHKESEFNHDFEMNVGIKGDQSVSVTVSSSGMRFLRSTSDNFVRNHSGSSLWSPASNHNYKPEWKIRGSLCRSSANSKKALSGLTAHLRFDHKGILLAPSTKSRWMKESLADP